MTRETRRLKPRRQRLLNSSRQLKLTKKLKKIASKLKSSRRLRLRTPRDRKSARPRELKAKMVMRRPKRRLLMELLSLSSLVEREVWDLPGLEVRLSALLARRTWEPGLNLATLLSNRLVSELTSLARKLKRRRPLPRNPSLRPKPRRPTKSLLLNQRSKPNLMSNLLLKRLLPNTR